MDKFDRARKIISEVSDARSMLKRSPSQKLADAEDNQKNLKKKLDKRKDIAKQNKLKRDASLVRKGVADKIRNSKFSKASTTKVSDKGETGITAVQQTAGNLIKTGVAAAKNVAKGVAKTAVGAHDIRRGAQKRGLNRAKLQHARAKERTKDAQKAKDDDRPFAPPKSKPQTYRFKRKEPKKSEPKRLPAAKDPETKKISGRPERKALPPAFSTKPRKFGQDSEDSSAPSLGAMARDSKKIRRAEIQRRQQREEFIHEVEDKERKADEKLDRVIDIMRGKNKVKVNPDVKENKEVQGGISIQDYDPNMKFREYEFIDLIKPEPLKK